MSKKVDEIKEDKRKEVNNEDKLPEDQLDALKKYWGEEYEKDAQ